MSPAEQILFAAANGQADLLRALLQFEPSLANAAVAGGVTALHCAAGSGDLKTTVTLLDRGARAASKTVNGLLPENVAANKGHRELARFLAAARIAQEEGLELAPGQTWANAAEAMGPPSREHLGSDHLRSSEASDGVAARHALIARGPGDSGEVFEGSDGRPIYVGAAYVEIKNLFGSDRIPLDSIQSIDISGLIWKHLDIHTASSGYHWECGRDERRAERVRDLILNAREAYLRAIRGHGP